MSLIDESNDDDDAVVEECIEELDELVIALDRYPPAALAVAIGTYLEGLLGARPTRFASYCARSSPVSFSGRDRLRNSALAQATGYIRWVRRPGRLPPVASRCFQVQTALTIPVRPVAQTADQGEELYSRLMKICRGRGSSREDARDLVQEAHMRLFEYQRSATVTDPAALLRRIVLSLAINHYRRKLSVPVTFESIDRLDRCGVLTDPTPGPERTLAAEQELDCVANLLGAMSPRTCQIFVAQRVGYSYEEIAAAFAIKPRTVEKHVTTAAEALWEYLTSGPDLLCNSPELSGPRLGDRRRIVRSPARTQIAARWPGVTDGSLRPAAPLRHT